MAGRREKNMKAADFWDFFSPVFVKELRQGLRANQFVWPFIVVQIAAIACIVIEYTDRHVLNGTGFVFADPEILFHALLWTVFGGVLPLTLFSALRPELAGGRNVELLLMSNLSRWQIVLGKWFVGSVLSGLMLVSLLPYWLVRYLIGNVGNVGIELAVIFGVLVTNATMNAIVIGASGFRNYVGRVCMILLSALCGWLTVLGGVAGMLRFLTGRTPGAFDIIFGVFGCLAVMALIVVLNLQMGRAKLRLFENPLDPPSTALIIVLIICTPIMVAITAGVTIGKGGWVMVLILLALGLFIDPGPGKKNRKWAQA